MDAREEIRNENSDGIPIGEGADLWFGEATIGSDVERESALRLVEVGLIEPREVTTSALRGPEIAGAVIAGLIGSKDREHFVALHLDAQHRPIAADIVSVGTLNSSLVHPREVFKAAILNNACAIITGHNHPSGDLTPSSDDWAVQERLVKAGEILGIKVLDGFVVHGKQAMSLDGADGL